MSKYYRILPAIQQRSSSPIKKAEPLADTTVAINLRFFEDESKTQAEREYDDNYGRLPDPPVGAVDGKQRTTHKKRRKVRSAIVSRRKSALYEKKLEEELAFRDGVNNKLKKRLATHEKTLKEIQHKIGLLEADLKARLHASSRDMIPQLKDGTPSRDASSHGAPPIDSPLGATTTLPSVRCIAKQPRTTPQSQSRRRVQPPLIHEPGDTSQVTVSGGRTP